MSNVIYPDCQDKYNWEQQGDEEKDSRQKAGGLGSSGEASAFPLSMDLNREAGYCIQQNRR